MIPQVRLVRVAHFSAGCCYEHADLTDAENHRLYGELRAPAGFGYNYRLEAHFTGAIDPDTGMIEDLARIDTWLKEVVSELDHHFLNRDVAFFANHPPTLENLTAYCFDKIKHRMAASRVDLLKVRVYEGDTTWVDVFRADVSRAARDL